MSEVVGTVSSIWRYPVKSMLGETVDAVHVTSGGVVGDRTYALIDDETGKVVSVKRPQRWGRMFELRATTDADGVTVEFPDGRRAGVDEPCLAGWLSEFFGRAVSISSMPPPGASFDEAWVRHLKNGAEPYFGLPSRTEDDSEMIDAGTFMSAQGNFFNFGAIHIVTTSTTRLLGKLAPGSRFDPHRFRANVVVETDGEGFVETQWQGLGLSVGRLRASVSFTVPRCVMTTLAQDGLPADPEVLRTITEHNAVDVFSTGVRYPCVGVYADVVEPGPLVVGDAVSLL